MAEKAGAIEGVSTADSLQTGKITGTFHILIALGPLQTPEGRT
jgi:hypothetical protein